MRKNSIKNVRINAEVQRALSEIIRDEVKDPRISPLFSVTKVYVAPDLKSCKAYISVIGSKEELDATILGLKSAEGFIRMKLARTVNLRNTPELRFIGDESIAYGVEMSRKIDDLAKAGGMGVQEAEEEGIQENDY
jgi:ribosome-binding factor A